MILPESVKHFRAMPFYTKSKLDHCHFLANFFLACVTLSQFRHKSIVSILCQSVTPVSLGAAVRHKIAFFVTLWPFWGTLTG